jgi:outer membrane lipoprotein-sorting protein
MKLHVCLAAAALFCPAAIVSAETPQEIVEKVTKTYSALTGINVTAMVSEEISGGGNLRSTKREFALAEAVGGKVRLFVKSDAGPTLIVGDGTTLWKAAPEAKQFTEESYAESLKQERRDLRANAQNLLLGRYAHLKEAIEGSKAEITLAGENTYKIEKSKVPCHILHVVAGNSQHDLWIDKERYLVVQHLEKRKGEMRGQPMESKMKVEVKHLGLANELNDSMFAFKPESNWTKVDKLALPAEQAPVRRPMPPDMDGGARGGRGGGRR